jgi:hypothetical protein
LELIPSNIHPNYHLGAILVNSANVGTQILG